MTKEMSKSQIDRLGDRLRRGNITEADLRLLDAYRRSFSESYEIVVGAIKKELALEPTGRPAKSTTSVSDKLRREHIRLTQIQDIAGCRLTVTDIANQDAVVESLKSLFENVSIVDRRQQPSHGYRAVHVIPSCHGKLVEIQIRTSLQHLWAELSEKLSDAVDPLIKYGGGDETIRTILTLASSIVAGEELAEMRLVNAQSLLSSQDGLADNSERIAEVQKALSLRKQVIFKYLRNMIARLEKLKEKKDALSD